MQMNQVAAKLNDREIKAVADYIAETSYRWCDKVLMNAQADALGG